jgi:hypothetical protein
VYAGNDPINHTDPLGLCANGYNWYGGYIRAFGLFSLGRCPLSRHPGSIYRPGFLLDMIPPEDDLVGLTGTSTPSPSSPTIGASRSRIQNPDPEWQSSQCFWAAGAALYATVEDVSTLFGVGLALKGVRGARAGVKLAAVGQRLAYETLSVPLPGQRVGSRYMMQASGKYSWTLMFGATTSALSGQEYGMTNIVTGFIPGVNMGLAARDAYRACS